MGLDRSQQFTIVSTDSLTAPCFDEWPYLYSWYNSAVEFSSLSSTSADSSSIASSGKDTIYLDSGTNLIIAGPGDDVIKSFGGQNTVLGDDGEVLITRDQAGQATKTTLASTNGSIGGEDTIYLVAGENRVIGGAAIDSICTVASATASYN